MPNSLKNSLIAEAVDTGYQPLKEYKASVRGAGSLSEQVKSFSYHT